MAADHAALVDDRERAAREADGLVKRSVRRVVRHVAAEVPLPVRVRAHPEQRAVAVPATPISIVAFPAAVRAIPRVLCDALDKVRHRLGPEVRREVVGPLRAVEEARRR